MISLLLILTLLNITESYDNISLDNSDFSSDIIDSNIDYLNETYEPIINSISQDNSDIESNDESIANSNIHISIASKISELIILGTIPLIYIL